MNVNEDAINGDIISRIVTQLTATKTHEHDGWIAIRGGAASSDEHP